MFKFSKKQDLIEFRKIRGEGVASIYLDDAINFEVLRAINDAKPGFDDLVEAKWHILLPYIDGELTPDFVANPEKYSSKLSLRLADEFGIPRSELPALVFPHDENMEAVLTVKLGRLSKDEVIEIIRHIAEIVIRPTAQNLDDPTAFRREVIAEIRAALLNDKVFQAVKTGKKVMDGASTLARILTGGA